MAGGIPSPNTTGWQAQTPGANPAAGFDPLAVPGTILGVASPAIQGAVVGAGLSDLKNRTQDVVTLAYRTLVQNNPVLTGWSSLIFGGLNPDGQTPLPLLIINKIAESFGIDPSLLTSIESSLGQIGNLFSGFTGGNSILTDIENALTGGTGTGTVGSLQNIASFFAKVFGGLDLTKNNPIIAAIEAAIAQIPGVGPVIDGIINSITGGNSTGNTATDLVTTLTGFFSGLSGSNSILTDIENAVTGTSKTGTGGGLAGIANFFSGFTGGSSLLSQIISAGGGTGSALSDLEAVFNGFTGGSGGGIDWGALVQALFGLAGGNQGMFTTLGGNLMNLLANVNLNPAGGGFDPIAAWQQLLSTNLTPAGALSTQTPIPPHLLGALSMGSSNNELPDPGFANASTIVGQGMWFWDGTVDHTGTPGSGSAKTIGAGVLRQLLSVPITVAAGKQVDVSTYTMWSGVTAAGQSINLCVNAYDANDNPISDPNNRITASISNPMSGSGWQQISGTYKTPTGTAYVRLCLEVTAQVTAGNVWFDDCSLVLASGKIDASLLDNVANMPALPPEVVQGIQGIETLVATFSHVFDGLGSAFSGQQQSGIDMSQLFSLAQSTNSAAGLAQQLATSAKQILNIRTNKSTGHGLNVTSETAHPIASFSSGTTGLLTTAIPAGSSVTQIMNISETATKGFFEFMAQSNGGSGVYTNVFKVDRTSKSKTLLWGSPDLAGQLPSGALGYVRALIPGNSQPTVNPGDLLHLEIVNNTTSALTVAAKNLGTPSHPTEFPPNFGASRTTSSTGGASPATLTDSQVTYNATVPYVNFGIANVPANYYAPIPQEFTDGAAYQGASYVYNIPSVVQVGDLIDVIGLGAGGGGSDSLFAATGNGGYAGSWNAKTLVYGTDIPAGTTQLLVTIGKGGFDPGYSGGANGTGTATTVSLPNGTVLLSAAGGVGGTPNNSNGGNGQGAGTFTWQGQNYFGGASVGNNTDGASPGGGGGGGFSYSAGGYGSDGAAWFRARQAGS